MNTKIIKKESAPLMFYCNDGKTYYSVNFRMYIHFDPITIPVPDGFVYKGCPFAPVKMEAIRLVDVAARTVGQSRSFMIDSSKVYIALDKYVESKLNTYTSHSYWELYKNLIISDYLEDIKQRYNVDLHKSSLKYSVQFCWSIDVA